MNLSPRTTRTALVTLTAPALLLLGGPLTTASAAEPVDRATAEEHCTYDVDSARTACYATLPEALDAVPGPAPATGSRDVADDERPEGSVILGTFFTETGFGGSSYTVWGGSPCEADGELNWRMDSFPDWVSGTNSLQTWANCGIYVYSEDNLGGDRDGRFDGNVTDIGPLLGDRVESASFH